MKILLVCLLWCSTALANQRLYERNCTKCHNMDPSKAGPIGPELVTTPQSVFRTKIVHGTYPKDYVPKRKTKIMPKFKLFDWQVDSLYWYVQMFKKVK